MKFPVVLNLYLKKNGVWRFIQAYRIEHSKAYNEVLRGLKKHYPNGWKLSTDSKLEDRLNRSTKRNYQAYKPPQFKRSVRHG